jgi:hypothetical protein
MSLFDDDDDGPGLKRRDTDEATRELIRQLQSEGDSDGPRAPDRPRRDQLIGGPGGMGDDPYGIDSYRQRVLDGFSTQRPVRYGAAAPAVQRVPSIDPEVERSLRELGMSEQEIRMQKQSLRDREILKKMKAVDDKYPDNDLEDARRLAAMGPGYRGPQPRAGIEGPTREIDKILERATR